MHCPGSCFSPNLVHYGKALDSSLSTRSFLHMVHGDRGVFHCSQIWCMLRAQPLRALQPPHCVFIPCNIRYNCRVGVLQVVVKIEAISPGTSLVSDAIKTKYKPISRLSPNLVKRNSSIPVVSTTLHLIRGSETTQNRSTTLSP